MANYKDLMASRIANLPDETNEHVIEALAKREVEKRATAIVKVLDEQDKLVRELRKINPDNITYNDDGSTASATWSKAQLDLRKKTQEKLDKIEKALAEAFSGKMDNVYNLANQAKG